MATNYSNLDRLTDEEVKKFKDEARERNYNAHAEIMQKRQYKDRIIAEGDSWFDYIPGTDLIDCLINHYGYAIDNHAKAGDTLENMTHGASIDVEINRLAPEFRLIVEKIKRLQSRVFLFSGGGNDVAGDEFINYLNHHDTGLPAIKKEYADYMVNTVFRRLLNYMIREVTTASPAIQIIIHGYGRTAPTGKGLLWWGPWLKPALIKKKILDNEEQRGAVFYMIDCYNNMLQSLSDEHKNFNYLNLTNYLDPDKDWVNELHLKNSKFAAVSQMIHEKIDLVTGGLTRAV
jgi:hypothetical protein